jgi:hypothetical protein
MNAPSAVVLVPLLVTVLTVGVIVASTVRTVRAERRYNAVFAARWIETQRRRRMLAALRSGQSLAKRGAA